MPSPRTPSAGPKAVQRPVGISLGRRSLDIHTAGWRGRQGAGAASGALRWFLAFRSAPTNRSQQRRSKKAERSKRLAHLVRCSSHRFRTGRRIGNPARSKTFFLTGRCPPPRPRRPLRRKSPARFGRFPGEGRSRRGEEDVARRERQQRCSRWSRSSGANPPSSTARGRSFRILETRPSPSFQASRSKPRPIDRLEGTKTILPSAAPKSQVVECSRGVNTSADS